MPQKTIIPFVSLPTYPVDSEVTVVDLTKDGLPFIPVLGDAHYSRPGDGTVPHVHPGMIEILFCRRGEELSFDCAGEVVPFRVGDVFVAQPETPHFLRKYPKSLEQTGTMSNNGYSFSGCTSLTKIQVPDGVTIIPRYCFLGSDCLKTVELPNTLVLIECGAFAHCGEMEEIFLPAGLQKIEDMAFESCGKLATVHLPLGVLLEGDPFSGCPFQP